MSKVMTVEILSRIKGAKESETINELFDVIKNANTLNDNNSNNQDKAVSLEDLREDIVIPSPKEEVDIIIENFPKEKNRFLVVSKVIEE